MSPASNGQRFAALLTLLLPACAGAPVNSQSDRASAPVELALPSWEARDRALPTEDATSWQVHEARREQYIAAALQSHPELRAQFAAWQAAALQEEVAGALPAPQLRFTEFIEEVQTRTGPQQRRIGVTQRFPWSGSLKARREHAAAEARILSLALADSALQVVRRVELAYDAYAHLARDREVLQELRALLTTFEPIVQARVRTGGSQEDLLRLQIEIGRVEDELAANQARRRAQYAALLEAAGRGHSLEDLPDLILDEASAVAWDREALFRQAAQHNPALARWEARYEAAIRGARVEDFARTPSWVIGAETILTGDAPVAGVPGSGDDPWMITIGVDLPIWGASYDAREEQARQRIAEARARWENASLQLRTQIEMHAFLAEDAARQIDLYRSSLLPRAEEVVQLTLASYRAGKASALDWIDAQRTLLALRRAYWRAQLDQQQAQVELRTLTAEAVR